ncbi:DUF3093 domain-containing protein [Amycolatopsis sp. cg5]|uniref:DUF3093 domain-containing protein n=1 Tax=Amycolatopsis sp. cg5 TaxID=3238802 RepID=UPI00352446A3
MAKSVSAAVQGTIRYSERLYVPWWNWPLPLIGGALMAATIDLGYPGLRGWLPYVVVEALVVAIILTLGRAKVRITDTELLVGDAHIPLEFLGEAEIFDRDHKRAALGRDADPAAFVAHRGWVGPAVRVRLTDPDDPTPYWLFSTRKPERVAELLRQA